MQTAILMDGAAPSAAANHAGTSGTAGVVNGVAHAAGGVPATTLRTLSVVFPLVHVLVLARRATMISLRASMLRMPDRS